MCSSDDLFLEDEDADKSFSFHLKLVELLPKTSFCIKDNDTQCLWMLLDICVYI